MMDYANKVIPSFKPAEWDKIAQGILDLATVVNMAWDESTLGVICEIIENDIKREFDVPVKMMHSTAVIVDGVIHLKMSAIQNSLNMSGMQQLARSAKKLGKLFRTIGFRKNTRQINGKAMAKVWSMNHGRFMEFINQKEEI